MSNFDPRSPNYVAPGSVLAFDGASYAPLEGNQTATTILASSSLSASTAINGIANYGCRGALFVLDVTQVPGSGSTTVALKLQVTNPRTAVFASIAGVSLGTSAVMIYPGISASAKGVATPIPSNFGVLLSLSTGATSKEVVLSLTMMRID